MDTKRGTEKALYTNSDIWTIDHLYSVPQQQTLAGCREQQRTCLLLLTAFNFRKHFQAYALKLGLKIRWFPPIENCIKFVGQYFRRKEYFEYCDVGSIIQVAHRNRNKSP